MSQSISSHQVHDCIQRRQQSYEIICQTHKGKQGPVVPGESGSDASGPPQTCLFTSAASPQLLSQLLGASLTHLTPSLAFFAFPAFVPTTISSPLCSDTPVQKLRLDQFSREMFSSVLMLTFAPEVDPKQEELLVLFHFLSFQINCSIFGLWLNFPATLLFSLLFHVEIGPGADKTAGEACSTPGCRNPRED